MKSFRFLWALSLLALSAAACRLAERMLAPEPAPTAAAEAPPPSPQPSATPLPTPATPPAFSDTCPDGNCVEGCLSRLGALSKTPPSEGHGEFNNSEYDLVTYTLQGDELVHPVKQPVSSALKPYQQDEASQRKVWNFFSRIIPSENRLSLAQYIVFSDGEANILASVAQSDTDPNLWTLRVDIVDAADPQELTYTLVHEYAHLLTLNPQQVPPSLPIFNHPENGRVYEQEAAKCQTYFPGEGCSLPDSYINHFNQAFWSGIYDEWAQIDALTDEQEYYAALDDFYLAHQSEFVSDYAPTNPAEDIAESFAYFALSPRPTGGTVADQKLLFFYGYPELVRLRMAIIEGICTYEDK